MKVFRGACCALVVVALCAVLVDSAAATKVLFHGRIHPDPVSGDDGAVMDHLVARYGAENVTYMAGFLAAPDGSTANGYDVVLLSATMSSSDVRGFYEVSPVGVVLWENALVDAENVGNFFLCESSGDIETSPPTDRTQVDIVDPSHPLAAGLSGTVTVSSYPDHVQFGKGALAGGVSLIANATADASQHFIFGAEKGGALLGDGSEGSPAVAAGRRVMFFVSDTGFAALTADGLALFDAAVDWAAVPEPGTFVLALIGLLGVGVTRRKRST